MATSETTVGIVVDRLYGQRLCSLPAAMPLWVIDTPGNQAVVAQSLAGRNITTFVDVAEESPEDMVIGILGTVDLHHGPLSQNPPYAALRVFGATATPAVRAALEEYSLGIVRETSQDFLAQRANGPR